MIAMYEQFATIFPIIMGTILLCSFYTSGNTTTKIIDKLIHLEENQHDLTELIMRMDSTWKKKRSILKNKMATLKENMVSIETSIHEVNEMPDLHQKLMEMETVMNYLQRCPSEMTDLQQKMDCMETSFHERHDVYCKEMHEMHNALKLKKRTIDDLQTFCTQLNDYI